MTTQQEIDFRQAWVDLVSTILNFVPALWSRIGDTINAINRVG